MPHGPALETPVSVLGTADLVPPHNTEKMIRPGTPEMDLTGKKHLGPCNK